MWDFWKKVLVRSISHYSPLLLHQNYLILLTQSGWSLIHTPILYCENLNENWKIEFFIMRNVETLKLSYIPCPPPPVQRAIWLLHEKPGSISVLDVPPNLHFIFGYNFEILLILFCYFTNPKLKSMSFPPSQVQYVPYAAAAPQVPVNFVQPVQPRMMRYSNQPAVSQTRTVADIGCYIENRKMRDIPVFRAYT